MATVTITYNFLSCANCFFKTTDRAFGNDRRDSQIVYICKK